MNTISIPEGALVLTVGGSGSGKSTFAAQQFQPTEIVSSDVCRAMVSDDATDQNCNKHAFAVFHQIIGARLALGKTTVADATNLQSKSRTHLRQLAQQAKVPVVVLVFDRSLDVMMANNAARPGRQVPDFVVINHFHKMLETLTDLESERYSAVYSIPPEGAKVQIVGAVTTIEAPGFDVIGDVHGCAYELRELLNTLGYVSERDYGLSHPEGRVVVFVGDLTDRGPNSVEALRILQGALASGHYAVRGNHCNKLWKALKGNKVQRTHGLAETLNEIDARCDDAEKAAFREMLGALPHQLVLRSPSRSGDVVVAHAGIPVSMIGRDTDSVRAHALFGEVTGVDADGFPIRGLTYQDGWVAEEGAPFLVHGHTPVPDPLARHGLNCMNIDQGVVFGGALTAFRWPQQTVVHVKAYVEYAPHRHEGFAASVMV